MEECNYYIKCIIKHYFFVACLEDECTGILLHDFYNLTKNFENKFMYEIKNAEPPWENLNAIEKKLGVVRKALRERQASIVNFESLVENNVPQELRSKTKNLIQKVRDDEKKL